MDRTQIMRDSFAVQAGHCARLGSPFTAMLLEAVGAGIDTTTATGRRVLSWKGVPDATGDAVALRLAGALKALVSRGRLPALAALYPPAALPTPHDLAKAALAAIAEADDEIVAFLDFAPQTNEVARSAVLYAGFMTIAAETGLPLRLFELGASAGLNLIPDHYAYRFGEISRGKAGSRVQLAPAWTGPSPTGLEPHITGRHGCDLNPLDLSVVAERERMLAYIWPDQPLRLARIEAAIELALAVRPELERADAADWVARMTAAAPVPGEARVLFHSIAYQYFPEAVKARISDAMAAAGQRATPETPLAWLAFEMTDTRGPELILHLWPGGEPRVLAEADAHVRAVTWLGGRSDPPSGA